MRRSAPHSRTALLDSPSLPVFLGAGMTYALVLFGVCGFRLATPPPTLGAWCVLAFLALFLGLAHGALAALAAALLGRLLAARRWPRGVAIWWNVAGILVLVNTVLHAQLSAPTRFQRIVTDPPITLIVSVPYVWLAAFLVPLAWGLHVISIRQLRRPG